MSNQQQQAGVELSDEVLDKLVTSYGTGGWQTSGDMKRFAKTVLAAADRQQRGKVEPVATADALARIAELEEQLAPFLEAEAKTNERYRKKERTEEICGVLFPSFNAVHARSNPTEKPPQWHEKSWWWNGVRIAWDESDIESFGDLVTVELSSYVGGGESESTTVKFPSAWLAADVDWLSAANSFVAEKTAQRESAETARKAAAAERQIAEARDTLRRLTGKETP